MIRLTITNCQNLYLKLHVKNKVKHFEQINCTMIDLTENQKKSSFYFIFYFFNKTKHLHIKIWREEEKSTTKQREFSEYHSLLTLTNTTAININHIHDEIAHTSIFIAHNSKQCINL